MRMVILVALSVWAGSCGGGSSGPCAQRSGTYRLNFTERTGTCGAIPEQITTIDSEPTAPDAPCTGEIRYSMDNCEVTLVNIVCPQNTIAAGDTSTENGKVTWSQDGASGNGQEQLVVKTSTGQIQCQSSYDLVGTRL